VAGPIPGASRPPTRSEAVQLQTRSELVQPRTKSEALQLRTTSEAVRLGTTSEVVQQGVKPEAQKPAQYTDPPPSKSVFPGEHDAY